MVTRVRASRQGWVLAVAGLLIVAATAALVFRRFHSPQGDIGKVGHRVLRVLAYSSFVSSWGPGPEIAKRFFRNSGVEVVLQDGEDAGLLLKKLALFPADVVVGLDQFLLSEARQAAKWKTVPASGRFAEAEFAAFDWAPLAFSFRRGEIEPPISLDDLLQPRFARQVALQDPRTSSPGLQFLLWVLEEKGVEDGFAFLAKLKGSIHTLAPSWSTAYGLFQSKQAKLVFSYLTSPVYHWVNDKDESPQAAAFSSGHPAQIEYAGIPESCNECELALEFVRFLHEPEIQKIIMEKNYMLPVIADVEKGTAFERLPAFKVLPLRSAPELLRDREALFRRWQALGL